ncbi:hypothetical protein JYT79_01655 [Cardiobacterium sp. AH-315-I02]|nr:hypothetical protein [Cardiobacterium sp. AH-315-I02]
MQSTKTDSLNALVYVVTEAAEHPDKCSLHQRQEFTIYCGVHNEENL